MIDSILGHYNLSIIHNSFAHNLELDYSLKLGPATSQQGLIICRKLSDIGMETIEEVLTYYPRDYQHCSYEMKDGEYATILGTVMKCDAWSSKGNATLKLRLCVDPDALKELEADTEVTLSGKFCFTDSMALSVIFHSSFQSCLLH